MTLELLAELIPEWLKNDIIRMIILLMVYNKWKPTETRAISKSCLDTIDHKTKPGLISEWHQN